MPTIKLQKKILGAGSCEYVACIHKSDSCLSHCGNRSLEAETVLSSIRCVRTQKNIFCNVDLFATNHHIRLCQYTNTAYSLLHRPKPVSTLRIFFSVV